jgi:signal transduction histidine kinase
VLQQETVALADLVDELAEFYAPVCEEKELALEVDAEDVKVSADRGLLVRAVSNLLENAIRETPRLGRLRVAVLSRDGEVEVRVSDSGRGVPEADRERIFERFVQLDAARTGSSAGLGLPLARMIARLHGGDLRAGRSRLGGARFTLSIPFPGSRRRR